MPPKPGVRPPNAGKRGRKPGTPNRVTGTTREMFAAFVEGNAATVQELFDRVARRNPARALEILSRFSEFVLPRLQRTEFDARINTPRSSPPIADLTAAEAAKAYFAVMGGENITFAAPKPKVVGLPAPTPQAVLAAPPETAAASPAAEGLTPEPQPAPSAPATAPLAREPASASKPEGVKIWERLGQPDPGDPTVVAIVEPPLAHVHRALADSRCRQCRQMWVASIS